MMRSTRDGFHGLRRRALGPMLVAACLATGAASEIPPADAGSDVAAPAPEGGADEARIPTVAAAKRLLGVEADRAEQGALLRLRADGRISEVRASVLDNPDRLVLDLPGLQSALASRRIDVGSSQAGRVRVGQHDAMVRVVVDSGGADRPFDGHVLLPREDGLWVGLGSEAARLGAADGIATAAPSGADVLAETAVSEPATPQRDAAPSMPAQELAQTAPAEDRAESAPQRDVAIAEAPAPSPVIDAAPMADAESAPLAPALPPVGAPAAQPPSGDATPLGDTTAARESAPAAAAAAAPAISADLPAPPAAAASPTAAAPAADPAPAAPQGAKPEAARSEARTASVRVHGVEYDAQADRDRLVIVQDAVAPYSFLRPDAETLIVSLQDAVLEPGATVRVTPQEPGPVSLVTALQMPGAATPEVRIAIARAPGVEPSVAQQGPFLVLDFPRPPRAHAAAAATPDPERAVEVAHRAAAAARPPAPATPAQPPAAAGSPTDLLKEGGLVAGKTYTGRRISLDFKDVEIADVLRLIAEVSDLNVIAGDEVKGNVTIRLTDVPWDQALDVILLTKGLGYVLVGNVLRIAPQDVLKTEEAARLEERRAKEKLEDLVVKILPVNYASVAEVETMVKKLLTSRGSVNVDKRTNTLILKDIPSVVDESIALVKAVDSPTPQVLIESKIVEAKLDFSRDLGAVWGIGSNPDNTVAGYNAGAPPPDKTNTGTSFPFQQPNNIVVANPITSTANGLLNLGGYILDDRFNLTLQLQAAESNGEGKVISSPRVVTLDNREAKIEQGVSIPFQTFENGDAQLEFIDAVLSLLVTPHITADQSIIMKIQVTRNAPDPSVPTPTGSPAIAKNEARTETLVKNGQTLVLGGIYVIDRTETEQRVPYLYRIPILGNAFKNDAIRDKRRELLIFVTPRIVEAEVAHN